MMVKFQLRLGFESSQLDFLGSSDNIDHGGIKSGGYRFIR